MNNPTDQKPAGSNHPHIDDGIRVLRGTLTSIDALSQGGFSEIRSIARLALARLETPEGYRSLDDIANALSSIWTMAEQTMEYIACEAESVGCNYVNESKLARRNAELKARGELN